MFIAMGKLFFDSGTTEIDSQIMPEIRKIGNLHPRIMLSYGMLLWFSLQVLNSCDYIKIAIYYHNPCTSFSKKEVCQMQRKKLWTTSKN